MARYGYARVSGYDKDAFLFSTDSQVVNWFVAEAKKLDQRCTIGQVLKFSSGEPYSAAALGSRRGVGVEIAAWVVRHLGQNGWEPFSHDTGPGHSVHLRLRYD